MPTGFRKLDYPQVAYQGIFINDEDWGLTLWSWKHYEPSERKGQIGPKTHARIPYRRRGCSLRREWHLLSCVLLGRPHDYLWLSTASPYLLYQQMKQAYEKGIRQMWILNVGDIKLAEYQTELFMDMAWNIGWVQQTRVSGHLSHFLSREFGFVSASALLPLLQEHYRLSYIRKPEFMGHTRTEEKDPKYKIVTDLPWSEREIRKRLSIYQALEDRAEV